MLAGIITRARAAAAAPDPAKALRDLLRETLDHCDDIADAIAAQPEDEVLLFEDATCSIWSCRFDPDVVLPPHEHCMSAHIAVYRGTEVEAMYQRGPDGLRFGGAKRIGAGSMLTLGPEAVHAVTADGAGQSCAIHIYQGALTQVQRRLFNWDSGEAVDFTMENFHAMLRPRGAVPELGA